MSAQEQPALTLAELAECLGGEVEGDSSTRVTGGAWRLGEAKPGDVVRVESGRWLPEAEAGPAAALIVGPGVSSPSKPALRVANAALALARVLALFHPTPRRGEGIHPSAVIAPEAVIPDDCTVMALAVIGARVRLGRRVVLHPHVVIGDDCAVGDDAELFPHVTLYPAVAIGARTRIHSGVVIGADGFGYVANGRGHYKVPQLGRVEVGEDVEIGANTTIDRATTGVTRIGSGTKIDNLVQIGHNVDIGENCLIIAQVGLGGSCVVEENVTMGGQSGSKHDVRIGRGSVVAARAAVIGDLPPGAYVSGYPARPHREQLQVQAAVQRLPELQRRLRELERRVRELEGRD